MAALKGDFIGFQYGDYHSSDLEIMRVSDGSRYLEELTPTISDKIIEKSGNDGAYFFNSYYTQKPFDISFAFDSITEEDLMIDGKYVDVNCDFAIMLPMLLVAKKVVFIDEILYYFEPSQDNQKRINQYCQEYKLKIRKVLLEKSRIKYEKSCSNNRR